MSRFKALGYFEILSRHFKRHRVHHLFRDYIVAQGASRVPIAIKIIADDLEITAETGNGRVQVQGVQVWIDIVLLFLSVAVEEAVNAARPVRRARMAGIIVQVMTSDAPVASSRVDAGLAFVAVEVETIVALPVADLVEVRHALLLAERHKGRHHEEAANQASNEAKSDQVLDPHISRVLDSLLQVHALVQVAPEHAHFE